MMYYKVNDTDFIYYDGEFYWTFDSTHRFYQQYLAWLEEGNEPEEWTDGN